MYPTAYYTYNPGRYRRAEKAFYNKIPIHHQQQHHYPGTVKQTNPHQLHL